MLDKKDYLGLFLAIVFAISASYLVQVSQNNSRKESHAIAESMKKVINDVDLSLILTDFSYPDRFQAFYQFNSTNFSILCGINYFYETLTTKPYVEIYSVKVEPEIESNPYNIIKPRNKRTGYDVKMKIVKNDSTFGVIANAHCMYQPVEVCNLYVLSSINFMKALGKHVISNQRKFISGNDLINLSNAMFNNFEEFNKCYWFPLHYFTITGGKYEISRKN